MQNKTVLQIVRNSIYYIVYPIAMAALFWLFAATKYVEKDVSEIVNTSINKTEEGLYGTFNRYLTQNLKEYIDLNHVPTNDEIVSDFLNENKKSGWFKKKILHWSLVNSLEYSERKALEQMGIDPDGEELTVLLIANENYNLEKTIYDMPFKAAKGMTIKAVEGYLKSYYFSYYICYAILVFFLVFPFVFSLFRK